MKKCVSALSLLMILIMTVSLLSACGSSSTNGGTANGNNNLTVRKDGFPIVDEPITLTVMGSDRIVELHQAAYDRWNQNQ